MSSYSRFIESASSSPEEASSSSSSSYARTTIQRQQQQHQSQIKSPCCCINKPPATSSSLPVTRSHCTPTVRQQPEHAISMKHQYPTTLTYSRYEAPQAPSISQHQYARLLEADRQRLMWPAKGSPSSYSHQHFQQQQQLNNSPPTKLHNTTRNKHCCQHAINHNQQQQPPTRSTGSHQQGPYHAFFQTDDPVLLKLLQAMRFETELECLSYLQAPTLTTDEYSAAALSIRNSQMSIKEMRRESESVLDFIDYLIESLPLEFNTIGRFLSKFSELWKTLVDCTATIPKTNQPPTSNYLKHSALGLQNNPTIINCTPKKAVRPAKCSLQPHDKLALQIRELCMDFSNLLYEYYENDNIQINNGRLESSLRRLKEIYGKFVEISIKLECANIVQALQYDFSQSSLKRLSSSSSVRPVSSFESCSSQLPLKWALIALWQLTIEDSYLCRVLTEKWHTSSLAPSVETTPASKGVAKRLDYSTTTTGLPEQPKEHSLRSDYQKLFQMCQQQQQQEQSEKHRRNHYGSNIDENTTPKTTMMGALNNALRSKQAQPVNQVSTIELLIDIIISQPNMHERQDVMNFIHGRAMQDTLVDLDEWDQSLSAAIYTSNQYKVAALRILNHLCVNEHAIKIILTCFSTPPRRDGQPKPENKIIRSIFECYQSSQEHIYQNETMLRMGSAGSGPAQQQQAASTTSWPRSRKKLCTTSHQQEHETSFGDEYSDYGSRNTITSNSHHSGPRAASRDYQRSSSSSSDNKQQQEEEEDADAEEGDDVVVKEAIRLVVQLTATFLKPTRRDFYNLIGQFSVESLVKYLTNIIKQTKSREMLFLSLTALANISFITTEPMKRHYTLRVILELFRSSKNRSKDLELRDQVVTILANTAENNLMELVNSAGLSFLLSCLESCPNRMANYKAPDRLRREPSQQGQIYTSANSSTLNRLTLENKPRDRKPIHLSNEDLPDVLDCACDQDQGPHATGAGPPCHLSSITLNLSPGAVSLVNRQQQAASPCLSQLSTNHLAALERIHQKAAVAFARIAADPSTTRLVLKYGGIKQLIDLCKLSHKRNHSDTVLIACITALKKMSKVIESETFRYYNALDLIELEMNQALEIYGNPRNHQIMFGDHRLYASEV